MLYDKFNNKLSIKQSKSSIKFKKNHNFIILNKLPIICNILNNYYVTYKISIALFANKTLGRISIIKLLLNLNSPC